MTQRLHVGLKAGVATLGLAAFIGLTTVGLSSPAQAADQATADLYTATFVEQNCSGHHFDTDEWARIVAQIANLDPGGAVGQDILFTMESSKAAARKITEFDGCRHQAAGDMRGVFGRDIGPVL